ncbi:MAG: CoA transferase [Acidimicrobiales bacterium]
MTMLAPFRAIDLTDHCESRLVGATQLGAEVIAVEPPGGSVARRRAAPSPATEDPSARSCTELQPGQAVRRGDLAGREEDRERFRALVHSADILIDNEAPGALGAVGLGPDELRAANPALVHVSITPFGQDGPKVGYATSDLVLMAAGGYLALTGDEDRAPVRISLEQAWHHAAVDAAGVALNAARTPAQRARGSSSTSRCRHRCCRPRSRWCWLLMALLGWAWCASPVA